MFIIQRYTLHHAIYRPFPSSKKFHFQNEAKCETFVVEMSFNYDANMAGPNFFRPAELIQTPIKRRKKCSYFKIIYALGSVHKKFGIWIKAVPKSLQRQFQFTPPFGNRPVNPSPPPSPPTPRLEILTILKGMIDDVIFAKKYSLTPIVTNLRWHKTREKKFCWHRNIWLDWFTSHQSHNC